MFSHVKKNTEGMKESRKGSARNPPGNNKQAAREVQSTKKDLQEKDKHDIVQTDARVKPRSLVSSTSQVLWVASTVRFATTTATQDI